MADKHTVVKNGQGRDIKSGHTQPTVATGLLTIANEVVLNPLDSIRSKMNEKDTRQMAYMFKKFAGKNKTEMGIHKKDGNGIKPNMMMNNGIKIPNTIPVGNPSTDANSIVNSNTNNRTVERHNNIFGKNVLKGEFADMNSNLPDKKQSPGMGGVLHNFCRSQGHSGVNQECINTAYKSPNKQVKDRAVYIVNRSGGRYQKPRN